MGLKGLPLVPSNTAPVRLSVLRAEGESLAALLRAVDTLLGATAVFLGWPLGLSSAFAAEHTRADPKVSIVYSQHLMSTSPS